jgi:uncharacterized protein (DUF2344 family)
MAQSPLLRVAMLYDHIIALSNSMATFLHRPIRRPGLPAAYRSTNTSKCRNVIYRAVSFGISEQGKYPCNLHIILTG